MSMTLEGVGVIGITKLEIELTLKKLIFLTKNIVNKYNKVGLKLPSGKLC